MSASGMELITRNSLNSLRHVSVSTYLNDTLNNQPTDDRNWSWGYLRNQFRLKNLEELYLQYQQRLQHGYFSVFLLLQVVLCVSHVAVLWSLNGVAQNLPDVVTYVVVMVLCVPLVVMVLKEKLVKEFSWVPLLTSCLVLTILVMADLGLPLYHYAYAPDHQDASVHRVPLVVRPAYTTHTLLACYMFLPLVHNMHALILGSTATVCHMVALATVVYRGCPDIYRRLAADLVYLICVNGLGLYFRFMNEVAIRRTFLDRRACVESTYKVEYEKQQEEILMLSILPRHIIDVVRKDIQKIFLHMHQPSRKKPFSDMYVKEHSDVSILYADVVNYSKLTVSLPVNKLVETLNDLFGKFDDASENHDVLRIKFLGDCYYCVSGIPESNPFHAKSCVDLGLDMIAIIKEVREERNLKQGLDMRIGVHSGKILSGLLGVCKWQYDIWSRDVIIANHMEQAGKPGQVHVTRETLNLLKNEYKSVPGNRSQLLEKHNIETFFIIPNTNHSDDSLSVNDRGMLYNRRVSVGPRRLTAGLNRGQMRRNTTEIMAMGSRRRMVFMDNNLIRYQQTLRMADEQMATAIRNMQVGVYDRWSFRENINPLCLTFEDILWEVPFMMQPDHLFKFYVACSLGVLVGMLIIQGLGLPSAHWMAWAGFGLAAGVLVFLLPLTWMHYLWTKFQDPHRELDHIDEPKNKFLRKLYHASLRIAWSAWTRTALYLFMCSVLTACAFLELLECDFDVEVHKGNHTTAPRTTKAAVTLSEDRWKSECLAPWHITQTCSLAIIMSFLFLKIHFQLKLIMGCVIVGLYSWGIWILNPEVFGHGETWNPSLDPQVAHIMNVTFLTFTLHLLDRQAEYMSRLDFKWKQQLSKEQEESSTTHMVNKMLLQNILPVHVAELYLNTSRDYDELYHEEYDCIAVMFATITGYEIYDEEHPEDDDQMRSLKVLNEIICDFDKVLLEPNFFRVEKIKMAGWTYMAACGLDPGRRDSTVSLHREHFSDHVVVLMARFAAKIIRVLQKNNLESFQTFKLRVGISHGPITAGVVGSQKPLYDIWGDAVNMASRMDSTGEPGRIQVTGNTAQVLESEGHRCECRGLTYVKGKGNVVTYFVSLDEELNFRPADREDSVNYWRNNEEDDATSIEGKTSLEGEIQHNHTTGGGEEIYGVLEEINTKL